MYTGLLHTHNMFRWLVLLAGIIAISMAFIGWFGNKDWKKRDNFAGLLFTIFMDVQLLVGIILFAFVSPVTRAAFADFGAAMKNDALRFYLVEHTLMMVIAVILVHIGRSKSKKAVIVKRKHKLAAIYFSIAMLIILAAIPWNRALFF